MDYVRHLLKHVPPPSQSRAESACPTHILGGDIGPEAPPVISEAA